MFFSKWPDIALNNCNTNYTFIAFTVSFAFCYILLVIRVKLFSITTELYVPTYLTQCLCAHVHDAVTLAIHRICNKIMRAATPMQMCRQTVRTAA